MNLEIKYAQKILHVQKDINMNSEINVILNVQLNLKNALVTNFIVKQFVMRKNHL